MSALARWKRRTFTLEPRADAVRRVRELGSVSRVARTLDLTASALRNRLKQAKDPEGRRSEGALTSEELRRLRRENRVLETEREFLKRAAAFLAQYQDRPTR